MIAGVHGGRRLRRGVVAALALPLAGLCLQAVLDPNAGAQAPRGGADRPNIVVVMTDDQRADDVKVMNEVKRQIGAAGTTFKRAFATFPLCCPSRATYLTGQYAHNHGVRSNLPPTGGVTVFDDSATTAVALQAEGYRTGWIGKYLNGYGALGSAEPPYIPPGYDVWQTLISPFFVYGWKQLIDGEPFEWGKTKRDYQTDVLTRQTKEFIRTSSKGTQPFFLTVMPSAPHRENGGGEARYNPRPAPRHRNLLEGLPFRTTKAFNERNVSDKPSFIQDNPRFGDRLERRIEAQRLGRLESLLAVDDLVSAVVRTLRKRGLLGNTIVVFSSDNGFQYGEHRLGSKNTIYEESTKVPLVVRGPGFPAGVTTRTLAANLDLAATIYDASGVDPMLPQDGVSLYDLIADPGGFEDRVLLYETTVSTAVRTSRYVYAEHDSDPETPQPDDEYELYDLAEDPFQLKSVHDRFGPGKPTPEQREELDQLLDELRDCAGASCR